MAITINTLVGLIDSEGEILVSAFAPQSTSFNVDFGAAVFPAVTIETTVGGVVYSFTPVCTLTAGNVKSYFLDWAGILPSILGMTPLTVTVTGLYVTMTYAIKIAGSATTAGETVRLCFATPALGYEIYPLAQDGTTRPIYHNGKIGFYFAGSSGVTAITLGGVAKNYTLVTGYNIITLDAAHLINGTATTADNNLAAPLVYTPRTGTEIAWLDKDGKWIFWKFRNLGTGVDSKASNEIPIFNSRNLTAIALSRNISRENTKTLRLDTIAVDAIHYKQLTEIMYSPIVVSDYLDSNLVYEVASCSQYAANEKQNLYFELTLKARQNAVTY